ncbi:hypothetical protein [Sphingobacterium spiritivorum]|uniref:hypothetical protein n=1 Tax=Sphingobacterium spiritivorum TaxID=258 RepID=UPI003DA2BAA7
MKISTKDRLEKLIYQGDVYFSEISTFRDGNNLNYDNKLLHSVYNKEYLCSDLEYFRYDPLESATSIYFTNNDVNIKFKEDYKHAYCMYGFNTNWTRKDIIDLKMRSFGDHFALFDSKVFLESIYPKVHDLNIGKEPIFDYVKYYDIIPNQNIEGLTQIHKKRSYEYQREYRILANLNHNVINIGDVLKKCKNYIIRPIEDLDKIEYVFDN